MNALQLSIADLVPYVSALPTVQAYSQAYTFAMRVQDGNYTLPPDIRALCERGRTVESQARIAAAMNRGVYDAWAGDPPMDDLDVALHYPL